MSHSARPTVPDAVAKLAAQVIEAADRIRPVVVETPVEQIEGLAPDIGAEVFFKLENLQSTGSFKLRGASNKILSLSPAEAARGVIAASNGNHGLGVAAAAKQPESPLRSMFPIMFRLPKRDASRNMART